MEDGEREVGWKIDKKRVTIGIQNFQTEAMYEWVLTACLFN